MRKIAALLLFIPATVAAEVYVHLPVTKHYAGVEYETEDTYGVGYQHETSGDWDPLVGVYRNSNYDTSAYAGVLHDEGWYGYGAAAITGYKYPVLPAPFAFVDVGRFRVLALPGVVNVTFRVW